MLLMRALAAVAAVALAAGLGVAVGSALQAPTVGAVLGAALAAAALAWWDWDHETLRRALPDFRKLTIEDFLEKHEAATIPMRSQAVRAAS